MPVVERKSSKYCWLKVAPSASVGRGFETIDSSIWVAQITGLPITLQRPMIIFLSKEDLLSWDLDAHITTGDHDTIRGNDDLVNLAHTLVILNL